MRDCFLKVGEEYVIEALLTMSPKVTNGAVLGDNTFRELFLMENKAFVPLRDALMCSCSFCRYPAEAPTKTLKLIRFDESIRPPISDAALIAAYESSIRLSETEAVRMKIVTSDGLEIPKSVAQAAWSRELAKRVSAKKQVSVLAPIDDPDFT